MDFDIFLEELKKAGLSRDEFIEKTGLTSNTLIGWATKRQGRKTQPWVNSWIELYISNKEKEIVIKALRD